VENADMISGVYTPDIRMVTDLEETPSENEE
jgi:hypothetical protein